MSDIKTINDPSGLNAELVERLVGMTAYEIVKRVAIALPEITIVAENSTELENLKGAAEAAATLAGLYSNADTDQEIEGASSPDDRGAKYWNILSEQIATDVANTLDNAMELRNGIEESLELTQIAMQIAMDLGNAPLYASLADPDLPIADGNQGWMIIPGGVDEGIYQDDGAWTKKYDTQAVRATIEADRAETAANEAEASVQSIEPKVAYGRAIVTGRITALTWSTDLETAAPTVTIGSGILYEENNAGNPKETIAAFGPTELLDREAIIVDFDNGATDGNGHYIPEKVNIASGFQTGWQTARRYILVGKGSGRTVYGEYSLVNELLNTNTIEERILSPQSTPIDITRYGLSEQIGNEHLAPPTTDVTPADDNESFTLAAGTGRLYFRADSTYYFPRVVPNEPFAVWMRILSGVPASAFVTFYTAANAAIGTAIPLTQLGPFLVYEDNAPADADYIRLDINNVGKADPLVITRPRIATQTGKSPNGLRSRDAFAFDMMRTAYEDGEDLEDVWPENPVVGKTTGGGAAPVAQENGTFVAPADTISYARKTPTNYPVGTKLSWLVHTSDPVIDFIAVRHQGPSTSESQLLLPLGNGWYYGVTTIGAGIGGNATHVQVEIDNRIGSYLPNGDVTIDRIVLIEGEVLPSKLPSRAASLANDYDPEEIVLTQEAGAVNVFCKGANPTSAKYLRHRVEYFQNLAGNNSDSWRWSFTHEATRTGDEAFTIGNRLLNGGENWLAVREAGKTDFMGGAAHGDQKASILLVFVDGVKITLDGATTYRGRRVEFIMTSKLLEADVAPNPDVETFDVITSFKVEAGDLYLKNRLVTLRDVDMVNFYLAMLSFERHLGGNTNAALLSENAYWSPDFVEWDISSEGHNAPSTDASRIMLSGPSGYSVDVEVLEGWDKPERTSFVQDTSQYNKLYFSPLGNYNSAGPGYSLVIGDEIEMLTRYRINTIN
ncbi:MAG: hypothetical protein Unbinned4120contig1000_20 [Prokaryotic dsDNA virus sp.]|jgi:hypothetical protein|nr:MAG: hypothetical protein Unbinned4120contig1000_20 [Prokaryotic dsDNA virus sp.]|tara:strand:+ start:43488 stop:46355 length:2868 start_codon:yes stop_codon:yes gene_type:complete